LKATAELKHHERAREERKNEHQKRTNKISLCLERDSKQKTDRTEEARLMQSLKLRTPTLSEMREEIAYAKRVSEIARSTTRQEEEEERRGKNKRTNTNQVRRDVTCNKIVIHEPHRRCVVARCRRSARTRPEEINRRLVTQTE
jgi:hypothetical protein